jgi:pyridoxine/pyridoxamine 5'-phosphate oxidase
VDLLGQFFTDRDLARAERDPTANVCWAASAADSNPQVRTLVLRDLDQRLALFINSTSPMWKELSHTPRICIVTFFGTQNLQYRFDCELEEIPKQIVHDSWQMRPDAPKRMDWYYTRGKPQTSPIESRAELLEAVAAVDLPDPLVAPHTSRGLYLLPERIERLDLNQENGIHDRCEIRLNDGTWHATTLVP